MQDIEQLFANNRAWSEAVRRADAEFFARLANQQTPRYLWIGCSDSRVPANQIVGLAPGEVFVHRNVANLVVHTDLNALSVIQFAVDVLRVQHIIVVGHYGCGGVNAVMNRHRLGLVDNWLLHVQDVMERNSKLLDAIADKQARANRLCELNVMQQVVNISQTNVLQQAWERRQSIMLHGWCYSLADGLIRDLQVSAANSEEVRQRTQALAR